MGVGRVRAHWAMPRESTGSAHDPVSPIAGEGYHQIGQYGYQIREALIDAIETGVISTLQAQGVRLERDLLLNVPLPHLLQLV